MSNPEGELAWSSVELYDFSVLEVYKSFFTIFSKIFRPAKFAPGTLAWSVVGAFCSLDRCRRMGNPNISPFVSVKPSMGLGCSCASKRTWKRRSTFCERTSRLKWSFFNFDFWWISILIFLKFFCLILKFLIILIFFNFLKNFAF